jgi:thiol-disulfide isomerase/thioredoxin
MRSFRYALPCAAIIPLIGILYANRPADLAVAGPTVPVMNRTTIDGTTVNIGTGKLTVIALTGTTCPVAKRYGPTLASLEKTYSAKGVQFVYVNPAESETGAEMRAAKTRLGLKGAYVHDKTKGVAKTLEATTTTEVFLLNAQRQVIYRGAVDDQYGLTYSKAQPTNKYLARAIDSALKNSAPAVAKTPAPGCALDLSDVQPLQKPVTYHNRISRIIQENCLPCHRPGGVGPFTLDSFSKVKDRAAMIKFVVNNKQMPPWFAADAKPSKWKNDRSLSEADQKDLLAWIDSKTPLGDAKDAPKPVSFSPDWQIGKPDETYQLPKPISIKADGFMEYQNVLVPLNSTKDRWVKAIEIIPTARQVVHHILVFVVPKGGRGDSGASLEGLNGYFAIYVPGNSSIIYPDGLAKQIPANSDLRFQIHYTPNGEATTDQSKIGFIYSETPPKHEVRTAGVANVLINIPPGADNHKEVATVTVPTDVEVLSFLPHMHVRGKACRYDVVSADGKRETLLDVPRYDFNWQLSYEYAQWKKLEKGQKIEFSVWFDNSDKNPANPDPTKRVRWGDQTYEEMHLGYVEYIVPGAKPGEEAAGIGVNRRRGVANAVEATFNRLDRNADGFVTAAEAGSFWDQVKLADSNNDGKVSLAEAKKAFGG